MEKNEFFLNNFTFDVGKNNKSKTLYIRLTNTSKIFHLTVVKAAIECANKMISSITMKSENKVRQKISDGKKCYAALRLLDDKVDKCFLNSSVELSSLELFRKILKAIQLFYNMKLTNLSNCFDRCYQIPSNCYQEKTQKDELINIIHEYSDTLVNKNHEEVLEFKEWLLKC
jgi:hypothetical protein